MVVKVSVIVPVRNVEKYIDRCIESILNQTFKDIEILLMVGKCSDTSLEHCIKWQKKDDRIIIVSRNDSSLGDARNYALNIAKGEFVAYVDSDDHIENDYIEKMVSPLINDSSIDMTYCEFNTMKHNMVVKRYLTNISGSVSVDFNNYIKYVEYYAVWLKMYRKKILVDNDIKMYDGCTEDVSMYFMLMSCVKKVFFIKEELYHYDIDNINRLSTINIGRNIVDYCGSISMAIEYLRERNLFELAKASIEKN